MKIVILSAAFLMLLPGAAVAQQRPQQDSVSTMNLSVGPQGTVTADFRVVIPQHPQDIPDTASRNNGFLIVALPIRLENNRRLVSAPNVKISTIDVTENSSLLSVVLPNSLGETTFTIENAVKLIETAEGKAQLNLDLSMKSMTQEEKQLLTLPYSISFFDIQVTLPKDYDETTVNISSNIFRKIDNRSFLIRGDDAKHAGPNTWIVFPSPMQNNLDYAKLILTFLISAATILFQIPGFRERSLKWSVGMLLVSLVILGLTGYYTFILTKRLDFLIFTSAALPYTIYGLFASAYLFCARRLQATVTGQVRIAGSPSMFTKVFLYSIVDGGLRKLKQDKRTGKDGIYSFYVWQKRTPSKYQIMSQGTLTDQQWTQEFQVMRGETIPVGPIDLTAQVKEKRNGSGLVDPAITAA